MAEVLSQSQIDALLNAFSEGTDLSSPKEEASDRKYRKYDFYSPRKFTKDRIKMLNGIFDNYSRIINTRINGLMHTSCEVEVESIEEQRYYEFSNALTEGAVLTLAHLNWNGNYEETPILFYATPTIVVSMMDRMMGGNGDVDENLPADYIYTDLDLRLYENIMRDFISVMDGSWENYIQLNFSFGRVETNPTLVQLIGLDETVVLVDLSIKFSNCKGRMSVCLPGMMLSNIFGAISLENTGKRASSAEESTQIFDHLRGSSLEIVAELGRTVVQLSDIYNLNIGDVIDLNVTKNSLVNLRIGSQRWFDGRLGVHEKNLAVKIKEVYHGQRKGGGQDHGC
ncbi:MAG: flagellar motor switch protein FliM [Lawsonibacter sp.]